jgi:hypothetical protein
MRSDYEPPHIDPERLDFSIWHPIDHRPFDRRCREFYGGGRRHLYLLWEFKWEIPTKIGIWTHCKRGSHEWGSWFKGAGPGNPPVYGGRMCVRCHKDMPESLPG